MAGRNKEPIGIIQAKGKSHKTKAEIAEREASELKPLTDGIEPPAFLTAKQKKMFRTIAGWLSEWDVMSATDCIVLGRYVVAVEQYALCTRKLRAREIKSLSDLYGEWSDRLDKCDKQCCRLEAKLGLSPVDRARLVSPSKQSEPKVNRFAKFSVSGKAAGDG